MIMSPCRTGDNGQLQAILHNVWNAYGHNSNNDMINFVLREWCGKELNIYQSTVLHAQCHASFTFFQSWLAGEFKCKDLQYHLQVGHDLQRWAVHTEWFTNPDYSKNNTVNLLN